MVGYGELRALTVGAGLASKDEDNMASVIANDAAIDGAAALVGRSVGAKYLTDASAADDDVDDFRLRSLIARISSIGDVDLELSDDVGNNSSVVYDVYLAIHKTATTGIVYPAIVAIVVILVANVYALYVLESGSRRRDLCLRCVLLMVAASALQLYSVVTLLAYVCAAVGVDSVPAVHVCWMEVEATRLSTDVLLLLLAVMYSESQLVVGARRSLSLPLTCAVVLGVWFVPEVVDYGLVSMTTPLRDVIYTAGVSVTLPFCLVDNFSDFWNWFAFVLPVGTYCCVVGVVGIVVGSKKQRRPQSGKHSLTEDDHQMELVQQDSCVCASVYGDTRRMLTLLLAWMMILKPAMQYDLFSIALPTDGHHLPFFDVGTRLLLITCSVVFPAMCIGKSNAGGRRPDAPATATTIYSCTLQV
ncbi:PREDICTED: uncharacterized protein LOC106808470 [Priapulus caudatus]|uniref:Uncharacterized protein LOC106808470 n=1 Tax=Priapulus caudatus TaxID=37621 RepID=A0ABM1E3B9_PRICU|nr:PREDICTED: uncharacterized protein LOC106808470 [Priapulus caudatus]XP_014666690.1 PREDICTED: uncharacterized protein LOC106808470 [Priapulus caudatus]